MSIQELEALEAKMLAAMEAERTGKVIEAPTTTTTNKPKEPRSGRRGGEAVRLSKSAWGAVGPCWS
jgi:hypothetical protein